jgi:transposase
VEHVAIDLGSRKSQICIRSASGDIVYEAKLATAELGAFLKSRPPSRVILETCSEAFRVADLAREAQHEVRVVPSSLVRQLGVGARRTKTDQRDARVISDVSTRIDCPTVYVPSVQARQRSALCSSRQNLVSARTMLINHCRGWLRGRLEKMHRSGSVATFPQRMREMSPPPHIEAVLRSIEQLSAEIAALDKEIEQVVRADEVCKRLMTVPGVGPITALKFAASVEDIGRFANSHAVESYFGLVPGESSSGERKHRTGLTKAGNSDVRWLLVQAAWTALRTRSGDPMSRWAMQIALRRGKQIAAVALARKIAGILFAIWRDGTRYNPVRAAVIVSDAEKLRELEAALRTERPHEDTDCDVIGVEDRQQEKKRLH